jgi:hypothetical protein
VHLAASLKQVSETVGFVPSSFLFATLCCKSPDTDVTQLRVFDQCYIRHFLLFIVYPITFRQQTAFPTSYYQFLP